MRKRVTDRVLRFNFMISQESSDLLDEYSKGNRSSLVDELIIRYLGDKNYFLKNVVSQLNKLQKECELRNIIFEMNINMKENIIQVSLSDGKPKQIVENPKVENTIS